MNIEAFVRPDIARMEAYKPIVPFDVLSERLGRPARELIKLDANENPYGPSPRALAALADLPYVHIYPDPEANALREALADYTGVPKENLLAGAGADELIDLVMRVVIQPGDAIVDCPPTFGMYAFDAALNAARVIAVPRQADFALDVAGIEQAVRAHHPKLLFLASPNNPDGSVVDDATLERLLALPVMLALDEAYIEFQGERASRLAWVLRYPNLMVLRTFSKRAGLAGLRVGYGAFPLALMPFLWKVKQPYNVNVAASAAAIAALQDTAHFEFTRRALVSERDRLSAALRAIPFLQPFPSHSNFVLCRVVGRSALEVKTRLEQHGILIRHFNKPGLADCIRISVGLPAHTEALLAALHTLL